ncbi:MAG: T9SS type A sorting domain-containing protein [Spirosomataceae bacterium]
MSYFPNPATDKIQVVFHSRQNEEIQIYTIKGEKVYSSSEFVSVGRNEIQIPVQSLFHGQYILNTKTAEGIFTHKFIKQ